MEEEPESVSTLNGASFSVCLATYNGQAFLREQIDSVLAQLSEKDELLASDDGSDDATLSILESYGARLRIVGRSRIGGVVPNFERVLNAARGDLVALCDQDDFWLPGRLEAMRTALRDSDLVMANAWFVDSRLEKSSITIFDQTKPNPHFLSNFLKTGFVGCCMAFRRDLLRLALPFPATTPWHDWLIGLLACATGKVVLLDEPTLLYRRHGSNASSTGRASENSLLIKLVMRIRILAAVVLCLTRLRPKLNQ